jgi:acyl-coenzyme A thioesterase PaaI-like protein
VGNIPLWSPDQLPADPVALSAFEGLIVSMRTLQDRVTGARPSPEQTRSIQALLDEASRALAEVQVDESGQLSGHLVQFPGRAQSLVPPLYYDVHDEDDVSGHVTFGRFYLGGNGAVHGGGVPLLFDEILGRLTGSFGRPRCRTAYLHVNYRSITPVGRELRFAASITKVEGRKLYTDATLHDGERLVSDAEGLFVILKPGQP